MLTVGKVSIAGQMVYGALGTKATGLAAEFQRVPDYASAGKHWAGKCRDD